jgi:D-amino-acid oxidase
VIVVARHGPKDRDINYASPWAGAHYRPIPDIDDAGHLEADLAIFSHDVFKSIATTDESSGVKLMDGIEYFDNPPDAYLQLQGRYSQIDGFRVLDPSELPTGVKLGVTYKTWCLNSPVYLSWLERQLTLQGVEFIQRNLVDLMEAFHLHQNVEASILINCSGIGFSDMNVYPTRGITPYRLSNIRTNCPCRQLLRSNNHATTCGWELDVYHSASMQWWNSYRRHKTAE